ncbi:hypothetical protein OQA88_10672 [Cercophora sp. LCS_1]
MALVSNYENGVYYSGQCRQGDAQCKFFLAADDEPTARVEKETGVAPVPRTPQSGQTNKKRSYPTPHTDRMVRFKTPRRTLFGKSPGRASAVHIDSTEDESLAASILAILESDGVAVKRSTRLTIQALIEDFQKGLEARLDASQTNLERALEQIGEMEKEHEAGEDWPST